MSSDTSLPTGYVRVRRLPDHTILALHGEIDIAAALHITPHLDDATCGQAPRIVIDLRATRFLDASGLRLLCRAQRRTDERGGYLVVVCSAPKILKVFRAARLIDRFHLVATPDDAPTLLTCDEPR
ncbi:STAS domain-containing protein [Streptomyces sp. NPDC016845]|uniref:STAS domain-containing protein n=1 Tax=Streptomyces sp. NPDC016845 TaxID=3364972 RepID=UPI003796CEBF